MKIVSVIGASQATAEHLDLAYEVGKIVAETGAALLCGGMGGIMSAAAKGAKENNGLTIGILPNDDKTGANPYIDIAIPTGLGQARNVITAYSGDVIIALPGKYGTLTEIGFALSKDKIILGLYTWDIPGIEQIDGLEVLKTRLTELLSQES